MYLAPDMRARMIATNVTLIANELGNLGVAGAAADRLMGLIRITRDSAEELIATVAPRAAGSLSDKPSRNSDQPARQGNVLAFPGCSVPL